MRLVLLVALFAALAMAARDPTECEVCRKVLDDIDGKLTDDERKSQEKLESAIDKYCANQRKNNPHSKEDKLCYFITPIKREISGPMKNKVPSDRICKRLKKKGAEICELRFPAKIDLKTVDFKKMRLRKLRSLLREQFGDSCEGCIEKTDFIKRLEEYRAKEEL